MKEYFQLLITSDENQSRNQEHDYITDFIKDNEHMGREEILETVETRKISPT